MTRKLIKPDLKFGCEVFILVAKLSYLLKMTTSPLEREIFGLHSFDDLAKARGLLGTALTGATEIPPAPE